MSRALQAPCGQTMNQQNRSGAPFEGAAQVRETIEELTGRLGTLLPPGASQLKTDFENNARAMLQSTLGKMDLVTREEFEIQQRVLQKTRSKLQALEQRLHAIETTAGNTIDPGGAQANDESV